MTYYNIYEGAGGFQVEKKTASLGEPLNVETSWNAYFMVPNNHLEAFKQLSKKE